MGLRDMVADTRPLKNPHFRRLWQANVITVIGAQLTVVTVPAQIYAFTGSSAYVGLTGVFGLVPLIVFGLWGGALADSMDRRTLLLITTFGLIGTSVVLWLMTIAGTENVWLLLSIFAVQQAFFAVNQPTRTAIIPALIDVRLLPAANALNMTVVQGGAIAGPLVAGALIPLTGFGWLYFADAVTLLATAYAVVRLPSLPVRGGGGGTPGLRSVLAGLRFLRGHPVVMMSFVVDIIAMLFGMPRALFPEMADVDFGGPADGGIAFALLFAALPLGAFVGGVFSGWVSRVTRHGLAVVVCIVVWGVAMTAFGVFVWVAGGTAWPWLIPAVAMLVVGGAADMASAAFRQTILQAAASDDMRGRLQGIFIVVVAGGPRISDVLHGAVAAYAGAAATAAGGGLLVVVGVVIAALAVPAFVRYRAT